MSFTNDERPAPSGPDIEKETYSTDGLSPEYCEYHFLLDRAVSGDEARSILADLERCLGTSIAIEVPRHS